MDFIFKIATATWLWHEVPDHVMTQKRQAISIVYLIAAHS